MATIEAEGERTYRCNCGDRFDDFREFDRHLEEGPEHEPEAVEIEPMSESESESADDGAEEATHENIGWVGGLNFVSKVGDEFYVVNFDHDGDPSVEQIEVGENGESAALWQVVATQPARPDMDIASIRDVVSLTSDAAALVADAQAVIASGGAAAAGGGSGGGSAGGGGSGGDDENPVETSVTVDHDHDLDALVDDVNEWIENYSQVKSDLDPNCVEVEPAQATIPGSWDHSLSGETVAGLRLEHGGPWKWTGGGWDNSANEWTDDDEKEAFGASQGTFRDIMKEDDNGVIYFGDPHYENFVPAENIEDLTS